MTVTKGDLKKKKKKKGMIHIGVLGPYREPEKKGVITANQNAI